MPHHALIYEWLEADRQAPRKPRHNARRICQRLVEEHGAEVAETTVRDYVRARRRAIGMPGEAYVPQAHHPGAQAEVDWGEATVIMRAVPIEIGLFYLRACHSGASFVGVFPRMTQQAFLEGHAEAFDHFGGVVGLIRYDNLASAVKLVLRGRRRIESDRQVRVLADRWSCATSRLPSFARACLPSNGRRFSSLASGLSANRSSAG